MELGSTGESNDLVVRLQVDSAGAWSIAVDGASIARLIPLAPITLIIHVCRADDKKIYRTRIEAHGSEHIALIQSNAQLLDLIREWLLDEH